MKPIHHSVRQIRKKLAALAVSLALLAVMLPGAFAVDLNVDAGFYFKQSRGGTCTLTSAAMMLRRRAYLDGMENWTDFTENGIRSSAWSNGLSHSFTYQGMHVGYATLPSGTAAKKEALIRILAEHPEGIMLHAACVPHGILLTEYKDGQFYCADPSEFAANGIIPIEEAWGTRIENSNAYWYVSSEVAEPTEEPVVPEAPAASIHSDTATLLTGPKAEQSETACLIGQALGVHA